MMNLTFLPIKHFVGLLTLTLGITLSGCSNTMAIDAPTTTPIHKVGDSVQCPPFDADNIRMCTMQFDPVCTTVRMPDGSTTQRTSGNACSACTSPDAISYTYGECER